jgi:hypothetical protein
VLTCGFYRYMSNVAAACASMRHPPMPCRRWRSQGIDQVDGDLINAKDLSHGVRRDR